MEPTAYGDPCKTPTPVIPNEAERNEESKVLILQYSLHTQYFLLSSSPLRSSRPMRLFNTLLTWEIPKSTKADRTFRQL